jgi:hypothetical protein
VAAQIAAREPDEKARQAGIGGLALDRFEDFGDDHFLPVAILAKSSFNLVHST